MEIWELQKSFLRGKLLFWNASVVLYRLPGWWRQVLGRPPPPPQTPPKPYGLKMVQQLCLNGSRESSGAGWPGHIVQKSHILGKCILFAQRAMFSKRLKKTEACCYETYRMWREGKSWKLLTVFNITTKDLTNGPDSVSCSHVGVN